MNASLIADPDHLNGQVQALRALLGVVAQATMTKNHFREAGQERLERLRVAFLATPAQESTLDGIATVEQWLLTSTASEPPARP